MNRSRLLHLLLGAILLVAAGLKAHELATRPLPHQGIQNNRWLLMTIVEIEIVFGLVLLFGLYPILAQRLAIPWFIVLGLISLVNAASGIKTCGCFGAFAINPWWTFLFDFGATTFLWRWPPDRHASGAGHFWPLKPLVATLALCFGIPVAYFVATLKAHQLDDGLELLSATSVVILEPSKWLSNPLPVLAYLDIPADLSNDDWILLFYHHDCATCRALIPEYQQLANNSLGTDGAPRVAIVELPPYGHQPQAIVPPLVLGRMSDAREWFMATPCHIALSNGRVTHVILNVESGDRVFETGYDR